MNIKQRLAEQLDGLLFGLYQTQRKAVFDYIHKTFTKHGKLLDINVTYDLKSDKTGYTNVDIEIQEKLVSMIKRHFKYAGIFGEENNLKIDCRYKNLDIEFLMDALDGSEQFFIGNFSGTGFIIGVIINGEFACGIIADGNGKFVILPYDKNSNYNIHIENQNEEFRNENRSLGSHKCLLITDIYKYESDLVEEMAIPKKQGGLFAGMHLFGGSIAASFIKLFTGVYGAIFLPPRPYGMNSWDWQTNYHLAKYLGYEVYEIRTNPLVDWVNQSYEETFVPFVCPTTTDKTFNVYPLVVVHKKRIDNLKSWFEWRKYQPKKTVEHISQSLKDVSDESRRVSEEKLNELKDKPPT